MKAEIFAQPKSVGLEGARAVVALVHRPVALPWASFRPPLTGPPLASSFHMFPY